MKRLQLIVSGCSVQLGYLGYLTISCGTSGGGAGCYFWCLSRCGAVTLNPDRNITGKMAADWRRGQEVVRGHLPMVPRTDRSQQQETIKMDHSFHWRLCMRLKCMTENGGLF